MVFLTKNLILQLLKMNLITSFDWLILLALEVEFFYNVFYLKTVVYICGLKPSSLNVDVNRAWVTDLIIYNLRSMFEKVMHATFLWRMWWLKVCRLQHFLCGSTLLSAVYFAVLPLHSQFLTQLHVAEGCRWGNHALDAVSRAVWVLMSFISVFASTNCCCFGGLASNRNSA